MAIVDKRREKPGEIAEMTVIGNVSGKKCIIVDDIIDTAGTLCKAAEVLTECGAQEVHSYITHGVMSGPAVERVTRLGDEIAGHHGFDRTYRTGQKGQEHPNCSNGTDVRPSYPKYLEWNQCVVSVRHRHARADLRGAIRGGVKRAHYRVKSAGPPVSSGHRRPMTKPAHQIKDMQLYARADRILTELRALGINDDDPLDVELLSRFDQLHYHGTLALDEAMTVLSIERSSNVLEIGSGWGGPARYVAARTGAKVTAIELQEDYHAVALGLTGRCGLAEAVEHIRGDFLSSTLSSASFDRIVSWLALYHIPDRPRYLKMAFDLLKPKGAFFAEDLVLAEPISADLSDELSKNIFANSLVSQMDYKDSLDGRWFQSDRMPRHDGKMERFHASTAGPVSCRRRCLPAHGTETMFSVRWKFFTCRSRTISSAALLAA